MKQTVEEAAKQGAEGYNIFDMRERCLGIALFGFYCDF